MFRLALVALSVLLVACGGGGDDDSASAFAEKTIEQARKGQNGRRWDDLHPAHQAIVSKDLFITCTQDDSLPIEDIDATEEYDETLNAPGGVGEVTTRAVTVEYTVGERSDAFTMHVLRVDGDWKWFLEPDSLDAFAAGECP